uniref:Chitin synthase (EC) n=1 Tax=Ganoderma boninense TaxID=34458 RepID=A0A5K1JS78_9APHY|nr:Chitin synthase (EC [Ganoderma boninense]
MDVASSSRADAVESVHAAESLGHGSSADRHADLSAQSQPFQRSASAIVVEDVDQNKPSRKSSFVAEEVTELPDGQHGLFSPRLAPERREYFLIIGRATILIMALMWITLPVYWGALTNSAKLTGNLEAWFIDRDGARVGQGLTSAVSKYAPPGPRLNWRFMKPDLVGDDDNVMSMVLQEQVWIAVVGRRWSAAFYEPLGIFSAIFGTLGMWLGLQHDCAERNGRHGTGRLTGDLQPNATQTLSRARSNGDTTYDPTSAIKVFYSQARQEIATGNYIVPLTTAMLQETTTGYATASAQRYFAQINSNGEPNSTALQLIATAPQTIAPGISWTMVNLRPYTAPAAQAATLVGNIFLCIFSFMITMANSTARAIVSPHMSFLPYIGLRIAVPLAVYFPLSMSFALVNVAFKLPLGTKFGEGLGFILSFVFLYLGMAALGLSLEAMITIFTPRFVPFFLFILILYNISPVVLPPELQNPFYAYGTGFPIWSQALRTILFNTDSHLGRNAAVIIAWIIMSCATMTVFTWLVRHLEKKRRLRVQRTRSKSPEHADAPAQAEKGKEKSPA